MMSSKSKENVWLIALAISGMGVTLIAFILLGYFAGLWASRIWDGPKLWRGLGAIAGMFLGIANIIWLVRKFIGGTK